jgi:hypothetical protein
MLPPSQTPVSPEPPSEPDRHQPQRSRSAPLEPLPGHSSRGRLERILRRGEFAVTAELNPPDSANPHDVYERAAIFDGWVDGINAVDASGANAHMSSVGICALLTRMGYALDPADFLPRQEPHRHSG